MKLKPLKLKFFDVDMPITGRISLTVWAADAEEAIQVAMDEAERDDIVEWAADDRKARVKESP